MKKFWWRSREGNRLPADATLIAYRFDRGTIDSSPEWTSFADGEMFSEERQLPDGLPALPELVSVSSYPDFSNWCQRIEQVKEEWEKIVLARKVTLTFDAPLHPQHLFQHLRQAVKGCYLFYCQVGDQTFLGASPERLYRREGNQIWTEAVAGTAPADRPESALLQSEKDRREHALVVQFLEERLQALCSSVETPGEVSVLRRKDWQHLYVPLSGTLKPGVTDQDILEALHPTPAVGGLPQAGVAQTLRTIEDFDRGYYAAPIGYSTETEAEFCVAIRSGMVYENTFTLYLGCGIVAESDPIQEWEETETKMGFYRRIFGVAAKS